jgi:hypothetical protein
VPLSEYRPLSTSPEAPPRDEPRHSPQGDGGLSLLLRTYFVSGWAFLIPYLAAYLLYAWLGWPVNPADGGVEVGSLGLGTGSRSWVPCLLHTYWALHAIHAIMAGCALWSWWQEQTLKLQPPNLNWSATLTALAPWFCLALLFYLPGIYLEFPADTWHHYSRVNEWPWLQTVVEHSAWKKSSYFLAYSLIGHISPVSGQLRWFDAYAVACSLLLCWQYFRLARSVGLQATAATVFVLLQALILGNNTFSFYRYYGMSSTVFAQLGAIALIRTALEALRPAGTETGDKAAQVGSASPPVLLGWLARLPSPGPENLPVTPAVLALLLIIAFNHLQGLGIACLGVAAIVVWRLIEWRRQTTIWGLALATVVLSAATIKWYPRHPALDEAYLPQGWLTSWYGFNVFQVSSPTFDHTMTILGVGGCFSLLAGVFLIGRNHVVGWLTVLPLAALACPFVAVPFASVLAADNSLDGGYIIAFHRVLFAIPIGLAIIVLGTQASSLTRKNFGLVAAKFTVVRDTLLPFILCALVTVPAGHWYFNRLYNFLMVPPDDLSMRHVMQLPALNRLRTERTISAAPDRLEEVFLERGNLLTTPGIGYVLNATGQTLVAGARKWMTWPNTTPPSQTTSAMLAGLESISPNRVLNLPFRATSHLYTPGSITARISHHWLPQEVPLEHATQDELFNRPMGPETNLRAPQIWLEWSAAEDPTHYFASGAGVSVDSVFLQDRGRLEGGLEKTRFKTGDLLIVRPVMRAPDGNGLRVTISIWRPGFESSRIFAGRPSALGGENWIFGDHLIQLDQPGEYMVDVVGTTLWPSQTFTVRYHMAVESDMP